ncbi:hypothetical protein HNY73_002620 [Argiope bruennichi]|uniref:Uncharacterized protein n=2 Tax=Argiope bruennichi TaxID=94029 RepID=A0A8T0G0H0_ARGBR|nr:hypothetical protein HNY73_002620 [Argiope bruennichi]
MDYHIAEICEIELIPPPGGYPNPEEFGDYEEGDGSFPPFPTGEAGSDKPPQAPQGTAQPQTATAAAAAAAASA